MAVELNRVTTTPSVGDVVFRRVRAADEIPPGWTLMQDMPAEGRRLCWRTCTGDEVWQLGMLRVDGVREEIPWAFPPGTSHAVWLDASSCPSR